MQIREVVRASASRLNRPSRSTPMSDEVYHPPAPANIESMDLPLAPDNQPSRSEPPAHGFSAQRSPFDALGGLARVRELVDRFYDHMEHDPAFAATRALYPRGDLSSSREKLFEFLAGWLGGPQLYAQKHGHPRLRARHLPFAIGDTARDHWITCMTRAMDEMKIEGDLRAHLETRFRHVADFLKNQ